MNKKPLLLLQGPVSSRSGYGDHVRSLLESLYELDKFEIKVAPTKWGSTPQNQISNDTEFGKRVLGDVVTKLDRQPDVFIQVSVANEFNPMGKFNIGVTAGVETTLAPEDFLTGCNKMNLIIVPSKFTKATLEQSAYNKINKHTNKKVGEVRLSTPVEVLFEGINLDIFTGKSTDTEIFDDIPTEFNFLFCGHWLQGVLGQDRKDVGMMIQAFCSVFKDIPKDKQPGLILKTSTAGFSIGDRDDITKRIKGITDTFGDTCPPVYLVFGDLSEKDMNNMYNHPKVKSMVMFTKGEGYGRPLAEFATTGKPIIVSKWSGHTDFLPEKHTVYLPGKLTNIDPSAVNKFILKEASWFTANYTVAANQLHNVWKQYDEFSKRSKGLRSNIRKNFSMNKMTEKFGEILDRYKVVPKRIELKLPQIKKL